MRVLVVVVGKDLKDPLKQVAEAYLERTQQLLRPEFLYIKESKRRENPLQATEEEGKEIVRATEGFYRIAMDLGGKMHSSTQFAQDLQKILNEKYKPVAFMIGGATGLSKTVTDIADAKWSLSALTLPHRLAYLVLAEQIYRAGEILRGGPYHK